MFLKLLPAVRPYVYHLWPDFKYLPEFLAKIKVKKASVLYLLPGEILTEWTFARSRWSQQQ